MTHSCMSSEVNPDGRAANGVAFMLIDTVNKVIDSSFMIVFLVFWVGVMK